MIDVDFEEIVTRSHVYSTETHSFKINEHTLEKMKEGKEFLSKIASRIQKGMKQIAEKSSGDQWEASYEAILREITQQRTLVPQ